MGKQGRGARSCYTRGPSFLPPGARIASWSRYDPASSTLEQANQCRDPPGSSVKSILGARLEENRDVSSDAVNITPVKTYNDLFIIFQALSGQSKEHLPFQDGPFRHADCPLIRQKIPAGEQLGAALLQVSVSGEVLETPAPADTLGSNPLC